MPTVAIIGASNDRSKYGNKAVRAFQKSGYTVYPVNPSESVIEGLPAYKSISEVPTRPEMVSVYVRPAILLKLLPEIAAKGCDELWQEAPRRRWVAGDPRLRILTESGAGVKGAGGA